MNAAVAMSPVPAVARIDAYRERILLSNLAAHHAVGRTREAILSAEPRGRIVALRSGSPVLVLDGKRLGAPVDDATREQWRERFGEARDGVVVVFGLGAGHAVRALREHTDANLVVFEPDPGIARAALESGPTDLGGIPIVTDLLDLQTIWPIVSRERDIAALAVSTGYPEAFPNELRAITDAIRLLVVDTRVLEDTRSQRFREWIDCAMHNIPWLSKTTPFLALAGQYRGVPAFVVGAGPSLQKNVALLGEAAKKGIVFVVDAAGRALDIHGIEPQVLCSLEANNMAKYMNDLSFIDRVVRALSLEANPASFERRGGPILPFFECLPTFGAIQQLANVAPVSVGGSVSTVAFSLAEQLGCSPLVLVGQDLAYTDGRTHAVGTPFEQGRTRIEPSTGRVFYEGSAQPPEMYFEVPAWGGEGTVVSTAPFNSYRLWYEVGAETLRHLKPDTAIVNATEGGSRIAGFQEKTLRAVLDELPERGITAAEMAERARSVRAPLGRDAVVRWAREQERLARVALREAKRLERAVHEAEGEIAGTRPRGVKKRFGQLADMETRVRCACDAQPIIDGWAYADLRKVMYGGEARPHAGTRDDAAWSLRIERRLARTIGDNAGQVAKLFAELAERMQGESEG